MTNSRSKLKQLYVSRNGFDLWQLIPSSHTAFKSLAQVARRTPINSQFQ